MYYLTDEVKSWKEIVYVNSSLENECNISWYIDENPNSISTWRLKEICYQSAYKSVIEEKSFTLYLEKR